tara:strand:+ start:174 stop:785 length:612 start_codon:yes stop_codon:yes gene_type:complete
MMIIISSPSGAGKTTIVKLLSKKFDYLISISHTTRKPRKEEVNTRDYFFTNKLKFLKLIKKDYFIEYANVFDNLYGTSKEQVINKLEKGKNVLFDIDWQGAKQIKEKKLKFKLISFFILPPSKQELLNRLKNREGNNDNVVKQRMRNFKKDVLHWDEYDFVVINQDKSKCFKLINDKIRMYKNGKKINQDKKAIINHIKNLIK